MFQPWLQDSCNTSALYDNKIYAEVWHILLFALFTFINFILLVKAISNTLLDIVFHCLFVKGLGLLVYIEEEPGYYH